MKFIEITDIACGGTTKRIINTDNIKMIDHGYLEHSRCGLIHTYEGEDYTTKESYEELKNMVMTK